MSFARTLATWAFAAVFWGVLIAARIASFGALSDLRVSRAIRFWGRTSLRILGIRLEILNGSTIDERGARLLICNHQSALDVLWGASICPEAPVAIGKSELVFIPILNLIWWALDFVRINRKDRMRSVHALERAARRIVREGRTLVIAPEGTRTPDGSILPFKKGAFHVAMDYGLDIHPVVVSGAYELLPKGGFVARPGLIRLVFLPVERIEKGGRGELDARIEEIRGRMIQAYLSLRSDTPVGID